MKEYQTTCKANQKRFFQNQVNTLYSTDSSNLWKNWKNCGDEFEAKTPALKNETIWERYHRDLFRDNNFVPKNDFQQSEVFIFQKKLNDSDSARLISRTNKKELITVIKKLKNGKAPGLDRVSSEMIKASFEILKEAYIKLFNFVMTLGIVLSTWFKGLISPIHKSGDPLNPENYRPICV